ncbi:MAG: hypothetical protein CL610_14890 [Anaerolineaceae bacterium]|nr:hypothetical protein [Anaerolineaceae bacterium]
MSRSARTLVAILLFLLAGFMAVNLVVSSAGIGDWLLPFILFVVGLILALYPDAGTQQVEAETAPAMGAPEHVPTLAATSPTPVTPPPPAPIPEPETAAPPAAEAEPGPELTEVEPEVKAFGEAEVVPPAVVEMHPETHAPVIDASAASPVDEPDDLTVVEGIGPKMSSALIDAGISTYEKLAAASEADIRTAIQAAGMRFAPSVPTWSQQASYAAKDDWDGLKEYQSTLRSGRKA